MEEMVFMAVINFKVLPAASAAASAAAAAANSIYNCHMMAMGHILSSVPKGWGKTLPMILTALLMPPGDTIPCY